MLVVVGDDNNFFCDDAAVDDGVIFVGVDGKVGDTSPSPGPPEDNAFIVELIAAVMRSLLFGISLVVVDDIFVTVVLL